jgi:hypothetical protein
VTDLSALHGIEPLEEETQLNCGRSLCPESAALLTIEIMNVSRSRSPQADRPLRTVVSLALLNRALPASGFEEGGTAECSVRIDNDKQNKDIFSQLI